MAENVPRVHTPPFEVDVLLKVALLKLDMLIEALLPVPVAVPFDMSMQSELKLLNEVKLTPSSLFGVNATRQPKELVVEEVVVACVVVEVVVFCAATDRAVST